jgi:hypothetical protein
VKSERPDGEEGGSGRDKQVGQTGWAALTRSKESQNLCPHLRPQSAGPFVQKQEKKSTQVLAQPMTWNEDPGASGLHTSGGHRELTGRHSWGWEQGQAEMVKRATPVQMDFITHLLQLGAASVNLLFYPARRKQRPPPHPTGEQSQADGRHTAICSAKVTVNRWQSPALNPDSPSWDTLGMPSGTQSHAHESHSKPCPSHSQTYGYNSELYRQAYICIQRAVTACVCSPSSHKGCPFAHFKGHHSQSKRSLRCRHVWQVTFCSANSD